MNDLLSASWALISEKTRCIQNGKLGARHAIWWMNHTIRHQSRLSFLVKFYTMFCIYFKHSPMMEIDIERFSIDKKRSRNP